MNVNFSEMACLLSGSKKHRFTYGYLDFDRMVRAGIGWQAIQNIIKQGISTQALCGVLGISTRKISNIIKKKERLSIVASDRFYRLAYIYSLTKEVLQDEKNAWTWLLTSQWGLGGRIPLELLETEPGMIEIEYLLGRIDHGIF